MHFPEFHYALAQWLCVAGAALLVGVSKTGVPGIGILVVPILGWAFGGRLGSGVMLPLLIMGDIFAVAWYRRHAQWDKLVILLPWVVVGMAFGTAALWITGNAEHSKDAAKDITDVVIGSLVLVMLIIHLLRNKLGEKMTPTSPAGVATTGVAAGFATTVSNAAGPVMQMYMTAQKLPKQQFMGTIAWYFLIINCSKFPIYWAMSSLIPSKPMVTTESLWLNLAAFPVVLVGVYIGKWILPRISQRSFESIVILLTALGAGNMIYSYFF